MDISDNELIAQAAEHIAQADALLITAGAGMGVDSGLPDFRSKEGFWKAYPPMRSLQLSLMQMANPQQFRRTPTLAWGFYGHRLMLYRRTTPHQGFTNLLRWARTKSLGYFVFTSNVDGQFQKAGFDTMRLTECHGSIHHLQCTVPCTQEIWSADAVELTVDATTLRAQAPLPSCPHCGGLARPNILLFQDGEWLGQRSLQQYDRLDTWLDQIASQSGRLAIIELGAGQAIPTVRHFSEQQARRYRAALIRINPRDARIPPPKDRNFALQWPAIEALNRLDQALTDRGN
ncbi:MAG: NAD-dependent deacetylase [Magnetococcales bacterium]|nr:NAD-dependent deacetylase [Magnetococcales bacterium]